MPESPHSSLSPPITKLTAIPDALLRMLFDLLLPHQLGDLSLTCKTLHAVVDDAIRQKSVLQAQERSRHAEALGNGGFRLYTSMCRRTVDVRIVPEITSPFVQTSSGRPLLSMRYEGVHYMGRGTQLFLSPELVLRAMHNIITAERLLGARTSVRVHSIDRVQDPLDPNIVWTNVRIGINLGEETAEGEYSATWSFVPVGW